MTYFLLSLKGSNGNATYLVDPAIFGLKPTHHKPWSRAEHRASAFKTEEEAWAARDQMRMARLFEAPELNHGLQNRLDAATLVPVSASLVGETVAWNEVPVLIV